MGLMFLSKGVRVKGAHARGEQKRFDKAKQKLRDRAKASSRARWNNQFTARTGLAEQLLRDIKKKGSLRNPSI